VHYFVVAEVLLEVVVGELGYYLVFFLLGEDLHFFNVLHPGMPQDLVGLQPLGWVSLKDRF